MDFGLAAALNPVALLGTGSQLAGSAINVQAQRETNDANREIARENRQWQGEMSNTAHQREVKDLIAAGINPTMSASGAGASTPSGSTATMQAPKIELPDIMSYGISMKQLDQAQQKIDIDKANSAAGIASQLNQTQLRNAQKLMIEKGFLEKDTRGQLAETVSKGLKGMKEAVQMPSLIKILWDENQKTNLREQKSDKDKLDSLIKIKQREW